MRDAEPTPQETAFFEELVARIPDLHDWYHEDSDGTPWMTVSYDFVIDGSVHKTLRADYDGRNLRGGWSPSCLNWDDGVRAEAAMIDTAPPEGLCLNEAGQPVEAAVVAAAWFERHIQRWQEHRPQQPRS